MDTSFFCCFYWALSIFNTTVILTLSFPVSLGYSWLVCWFVWISCTQSWPNFQVWGQTSQNFPHFWHQAQVLGIPKTTLKFDDFLERLTELTKIYYAMVTVYYRGNIQIKNQSKNRHAGQNLEDSKCKASVVFPMELGPIVLQVLTCNNVYGILPIREIHLRSNVQIFYWSFISMIDCSCGWTHSPGQVIPCGQFTPYVMIGFSAIANFHHKTVRYGQSPCWIQIFPSGMT